MDRQEIFEKIVWKKAEEYRFDVTEIIGGTVKFDWHAKKVTHALFIQFNIDPGDIWYSLGWMPTYAYGSTPLIFANSICNELQKIDDSNSNK